MIASETFLRAPAELRDLLRSLGFSPGIIVVLKQAAVALASGGDREKFTSFCAKWPGESIPDPGFVDSLASAVAVVQAFPAVIAAHAARGIPFEITADTLRDLERKMEEYREEHGVWGFDRAAWMRAHLLGKIFTVGRLQYAPGVFREVFDVFRGPGPADVWALAKEGLACSDDGWPSRGAVGFETSLVIEGASVSGHLADAHSGAIHRDITRLPDAACRVLGAKEPVLHLHIPGGPGFTYDACLASLRLAREFFSRHFPESNYRAICCRTWLLDRALENVLSPESNILSCGRLFRPLAVENAGPDQHIQRIFGENADWRSIVPTTSLQRAAQDYLGRGGVFRLTSGYILWDDPILW